MTKYLLMRLLRGILSVIAVVAIVMLLIYSGLDRKLVFAGDPNYTKIYQNDKETYKYSKWEEYGYVDYVPYADFLKDLVKNGEITEEERAEAVKIGRKESDDSELVKQYVQKFKNYYQSRGYSIQRLNAKVLNNTVVAGGSQQLFACKDISLIERMWKYFTNIITIDNIHYAQGDVGERGISFTLFDPAYGGNVFSPAIIGNGTQYKYLLYFDNVFPFIHQNLIRIQLGKSYSVNMGIDVWDTMNQSQGNYVQTETVYPTGIVEVGAENLHTLKYKEGSLSQMNEKYYDSDYTDANFYKDGRSKVGYSFLIGIIAVFMAYLLGIPLGIIMARNKNGIIDKIGTLYIVFIIAVPSLAYIFLFKAIGGSFGLPTAFLSERVTPYMYILPIVSLALPSVANLMKWLRRYMIDQENSDYVKFARSGGLSEGEIFRKHILKNAAIPIIHGIPGSVLGAITGAIITERVYVVPGAGNLLTTAINSYDNGVIVGLTLFYAALSIISIMLGDILMSLFDPRISFSSKGR